MKTTLTRTEYLEVTGVLTLAAYHLRFLEECEKGLVEILGGDGGGHVGDAIFSKYTTDELLGKLNITVEKGAHI